MNGTDQRVDLDTIWRVPDALWATIQKVLTVYDAPAKTGRPRVDQRAALDGIIFRLRTGCQWNHLPEEFGNDASVSRVFRRWERLGIFDIIWAVLLAKCDELKDVDWQWQAADGCLGKVRGVPKKGARWMPPNASAPIQRTAAKRASRRVCLSKQE